MDQICQPGKAQQSAFDIQLQQAFLQEYTARENWQKLLMYHEIGSGKTCTSILIALEFLRKNPEQHKIWVILPARLKENYLDELMSSCSGDEYISRKNRERYFSSETPDNKKKEIRRKFKANVAQDFDIQSYQAFLKEAKQNEADIARYFRQKTKNTLIIIDEVHNLISSIKHASPENKTDAVEVTGASASMFLKLSHNLHASAKLVGMTATPVFDNAIQFRILVSAFGPDNVIYGENVPLRDLIHKLRGVISYFPGTSKNAYPNVHEKFVHVPMSEKQYTILSKLMEKAEDDDDKDSFMSKQRQASLVAINDFKDNELKHVKATAKQKKDPSILYKFVSHNSKMSEAYAPKLYTCTKTLESEPGKHIVYSSFIQNGIDFLEYMMEKRGWTNIAKLIREKDLARDENGLHKLLRKKKYSYKTFFVWDARLPQELKHILPKLFNATDNVDGRYCRVVLGSPSIKEGVSFKHVQYMHLLDPVWNENGMKQLKGRVVRFCSHAAIDPREMPDLKRTVTILMYMLKIPSTKKDEWDERANPDKHIYEKIIPQKYMQVEQIEGALRAVALDHYLFRNMYCDDQQRYSPLPDRGRPDRYTSPIIIPEIVDKQKHKRKQASTCPKPRRPDEENNCPDQHELRTNKHGDPCCYKVRRKTTVPRRKKT